jgi:NAD-dependent dihydropyrimidine dehydrogenase PreA subunit
MNASIKTLALFILLICFVVAGSMISGRIWGGKSETLPEAREWVIREDMTLADFGQANALPNPVLKSIFELQTRADLQKRLSEFGTPGQISALVQKKLALAAEHASKNWIKILVKFILWFAFLVSVFVFFKTKNVGTARRKWLFFVSLLIFGVAMGSDPSPMGTVKDAIHLYGASGAVFPPRMIALTVFLLIVFAVNKYICAWGCQLGVLQDLIFRLNQHGTKKAILGNRYKPPFVIANSVRLIFLFLLTLAAFAWGIDIVEPIDPFKIYNPTAIGLAGIVFIGLILIASLFVYRPWCHFFCPFGLVGWVVEKISRVKISVDYETCIACQKCADACPSTVMAAILKQDKKTIPDCFACYACRDVCPTQSIHFSTRKRTLPPPGHFDRAQKTKGS